VAGGATAALSREAVVQALTEGFLPLTAADDLPARDRRVGLREMGLPFETEPAITRHLAAFLARAARAAPGGQARPDAVLFNGGFFTPALARERVLAALAGWFGREPAVLENARPEAAVALGAAFYGRLRRHPGAARHLLIRAGSARSYYIGVAAAGAAAAPADTAAPRRRTTAGTGTVDEAPAGTGTRDEAVPAVCVLPRRTEEGTRLALDREFTVMTNQPAAFTLYSSTVRNDPPDALVALSAEDEATRHAPLVTTFRYGKRSRRQPLAIQLAAVFTETGTLELWCESRVTDHRWRLAFNLRGLEADPLDENAPEPDEGPAAEVVVPAEALERAAAMIRDAFGPARQAASPQTLAGELENALGHGKAAWPLSAIRPLADVLLETGRGRAGDAASEARWLNLTGFCTRPGFGSALDEWRVSELRKVYAAGLAFPKEIQNQVEWLVLWQRVAAGFTGGQQRELAQRVSGQLGLGQRKAPRLNPQIEREAWRLLASLERLDAAMRTSLGDALLEKIRREPRNASWLWAIGRLGTRHPLYGPLNGVVPAPVAARWLARLLAVKEITAEGASAIAEAGALTGDPARDLPDGIRYEAAGRLDDAGFPGAAERLRAVVPPDRLDAGRVFGESLPEGLRLA
jgi:hypothetical protein